MNDTLMTYISSVFSLLVFVPLILILYLTIKKTLRVKPILAGAIAYTLIFAVTQSLFAGLNALLYGLFSANFAFTVAVVTLFTAATALLVIYFSYARILPEHRRWRDGIGYGLGLGYAWVFSTIGASLFTAMMLSVSISDGMFDQRLAELSPAEAENMRAMKDSLLSSSPLDYVLLGVAGAAALLVLMAAAQMVLSGITQNKRVYYYYAASSLLTMYIPFFLATGGVVNLYTGAVLLILGVLAVLYLVKTNTDDETPQTVYSRPSPLLHRRYRK